MASVCFMWVPAEVPTVGGETQETIIRSEPQGLTLRKGTVSVSSKGGAPRLRCPPGPTQPGRRLGRSLSMPGSLTGPLWRLARRSDSQEQRPLLWSLLHLHRWFVGRWTGRPTAEPGWPDHGRWSPAGPGTGQEATPLWALLLDQVAPSPGGGHSRGFHAAPPPPQGDPMAPVLGMATKTRWTEVFTR